MLEVLLGAVCALITQVSKRTGLAPKLVAALFAYAAAFIYQVWLLITGELTLGVDGLQTALIGLVTVGTGAWTSAIGIFEVFKKQLKQ